MESLQHTHHTLQAESTERFHLLNQTIDTLTHDNHALQSRLSSVSDEIAKNAILSAAQERRLNGTLTLQKYEFENRETEFVSLQAKYELLSAQHAQLAQEQLHLHVQVKTLEHDKSQLESQLDEKNETLQSFQEQLFDVQTHNSSLENMLSNLRGSNLESVEMNLLQQMENQRLITRQKEENMKEKLSQAFSQITLTAQQRDDTRVELENRMLEIAQLKELLHRVQNNLQDEKEVMNHEFLTGKSREEERQKITLESLQNMSFQSTSSDDDQSCGNEDWIAQLTQTALVAGDGKGGDPHAGYISVKVLEWLQVVLSSLLKDKNNESVKKGYSESQLRNSLASFLQSKGISTGSENGDLDHVYQQLIETLATTPGQHDGNEPHLILPHHHQQEDHGSDGEKYEYHQIRIHQLEKENKQWKKFVHKILRKVAQLPASEDNDNLKLENEGLKVENESLQLQISTLQDHLDYMKHEMSQFEEICAVQKDLGRHETADKYDLQLTNLQAQIILLETRAETNEAKMKEILTDKESEIADLQSVKNEFDNHLLASRAVTLERDALLLKVGDMEHEMKFHLHMQIEDLQSTLVQSQLQSPLRLEAVQVLVDRTKEELVIKTEELESKNLLVYDQQVEIDRLSSALTIAAEAQAVATDHQQGAVLALQARIDDLLAAKEASQVVIDMQTTEIESLQATLHTIKEELMIKSEELLAVNLVINDQQAEIARLSTDHQAMITALDTTKVELAIKTEELDRLSAATVIDQQGIVDEYVKQIQALQALIDDLHAVKEASQVTIDMQAAEMESMQAMLRTTNDRLESSSMTLSQQAQMTLISQINDLQIAKEHQAQAMQVTIDDQASQITTSVTEVETCRHLIQGLEQEKYFLSQQIELLEQKNQHRQHEDRHEEDMEDLLVKEAILALESFTTHTHPRTSDKMVELDTQEAHEEHELSHDQITIHSLSTHNAILQSTLQQAQDALAKSEAQVQDLSVELTEAMDMEEMLRHEIVVLEEANRRLLSRLEGQELTQEQANTAAKQELSLEYQQREQELHDTILTLKQQLFSVGQEKETEAEVLNAELTELRMRLTEEEQQNFDHHLQLRAIKDDVQLQVNSANSRLNETREQFQQVVHEQDMLHQQTVSEYKRREIELIETITLLEEQRQRHDEEQRRLETIRPITVEKSTSTEQGLQEHEEELNLKQQLLQLQSQQVLPYQQLQQQTNENRRLHDQLTYQRSEFDSVKQELEAQKGIFEQQQIELRNQLLQTSQAELQNMKNTLRKQFKHELSLREKLAEETQSRLLDELNLIREKMILLLSSQADTVIEVEKHEIEVQTEDKQEEQLHDQVQEQKLHNEELQAIIRRLEHDRNRFYQETLSLQQELANHHSTTFDSIAVQTEAEDNNDKNDNSVIAVETAKELLKRQKLKLVKKHTQKLHLLEEAHILEKEHIIRLVRAECQEIVHETNHLLMAKKELVLQQQLVSETIAEISNRSMSLFSFSTPQRGTAAATAGTSGSHDESLILNSSNSTSGGDLSHHYTTANTTPMTTTTANNASSAAAHSASNNTTRAAFRYSNNSYNTNSSQSTIPVMSQSQSRQAPGSISPITRRQSSSHHQQQNKQSSSNHLRSSFPFPIPNKTSSSVTSSINIKDSAAGGGIGIALDTVVRSSGELYPEMLSPETTKQFVENLYKRSVE